MDAMTFGVIDPLSAQLGTEPQLGRDAQSGRESTNHAERAGIQLAPRIRAAILALLEAHEYGQDLDRTDWDFALEIGSLRQMNLSNSDLRWLVGRGVIDHAVEVTGPGDLERSFRQSSRLLFFRRTCFVITPQGIALAPLLRDGAELADGLAPVCRPRPNRLERLGDFLASRWCRSGIATGSNCESARSWSSNSRCRLPIRRRFWLHWRKSPGHRESTIHCLRFRTKPRSDDCRRRSSHSTAIKDDRFSVFWGTAAAKALLGAGIRATRPLRVTSRVKPIVSVGRKQRVSWLEVAPRTFLSPPNCPTVFPPLPRFARLHLPLLNCRRPDSGKGTGRLESPTRGDVLGSFRGIAMDRVGAGDFGWCPDLPDHRDYSLRNQAIITLLRRLKFHIRKNIAPPTRVDWREYCGPIEDQQGLPTSSAHAGVALFQQFERRSSGRLVMPSRMFVNRTAKQLQQPGRMPTFRYAGFLRPSCAAVYRPSGIGHTIQRSYRVSPRLSCIIFSETPETFVTCGSTAGRCQGSKYSIK